MEMTKEIYDNVKIWVAALRSGEYKQIKSKLQDERGYCCLGVGCKLFIPIDKQIFHNGFLYGRLPDHQESPKWFLQLWNNFKELTGDWLENLNDEGCSFKLIADLIEKHYINPYTSLYENN